MWPTDTVLCKENTQVFNTIDVYDCVLVDFQVTEYSLVLLKRISLDFT